MLVLILMISISDSALNLLNWILVWVAIVGTSLALLSMVGTAFIGRELSRRQDSAEHERAKKITQIEERQQSREITPTQLEVMQQILKDVPRGRITVRYPASEGEAARFAIKIVDALR